MNVRLLFQISNGNPTLQNFYQNPHPPLSFAAATHRRHVAGSNPLIARASQILQQHALR